MQVWCWHSALWHSTLWHPEPYIINHSQITYNHTTHIKGNSIKQFKKDKTFVSISPLILNSFTSFKLFISISGEWTRQNHQIWFPFPVHMVVLKCFNNIFLNHFKTFVHAKCYNKYRNCRTLFVYQVRVREMQQTLKYINQYCWV